MPRSRTLTAAMATLLVVAGLTVGQAPHLPDPADRGRTVGQIIGHDHRTSTRPSETQRTSVPSEDLALASASTLPRLRGYVGGDGSLTISKHTVPRGRYKIVVVDDTGAHNWHITGPYVDKATTVKGTGKWVWRVRLRKGNYDIVCDPHASWMNTYLKVTGG